jgi:hypothetical protein
MKELNWNLFDSKFIGRQQSAFERLAYGLFCSSFDKPQGIFSYKNQIGIETEPIEINGRYIGFQAKYFEPSVILASRKNSFLKSLEKAKKKNPKLNEVYFYINKSFPESTNGTQKYPNYILEIEQKAKELDLQITWQVPSNIQMQLSHSYNSKFAKEFFSNDYDLQREKFLGHSKNELLNISKTAIILLEIEKIKEEYFSNDWNEKELILNKLHRFTNHSNEIIADSIFSFLNSIADQTRANIPSGVSSSIFGIVLDFFPSSYNKKDSKKRIENGNFCINIGFSLVYDALIYLNNLRIAEYGLLIWKYVYRESKRLNMEPLVTKIIQQYQELESTLNRTERIDLENAKQLVQIFKEDLDTSDLRFPVLPSDLYKLVNSKG